MGGMVTTVNGMFQFTPLREGRLETLWEKAVSQQSFNSRPCVRGDATPLINLLNSGFQFTPLREGRPTTTSAVLSPLMFQFTPLREGRHVSVAMYEA